MIWFEDISTFSSGSLVVQPSWTFWSILVEGNMRTISVKLFWFWTSGSGDFIWRYYLELCQPLSAEQNHLCNFGRGHHEEHFCEMILNLDQWFRRRCHFKTFLIQSSGDPCIKPSRTVCANLVEAIMRNNSVKSFLIWTSGSGGNVIKRHFLSRALSTPLFGGGESFVQFW